MSRRFLLLYGATWIPAAALFAAAIYFQPGERHLPGAIIGGVQSAAIAAALGLLVWRFASRLAERQRAHVVLIFAHTGLSLAYALSWTAAMLAIIAAFAPRAVLRDFMESAIGWQILTGLFVYGMIAGIAHAVTVGRRLEREREAFVRADALRAHAELGALRAQMNPHFLFNTLHSMAALVRSDPGAVEDALERLALVMRRLLDVNRMGVDHITLAEEWEIVRDQLELERLRFGHRLRIVTSLEGEALECRIPVFTLQPLVENALRHGVGSTALQCTIHISARVAGDSLEIEVRDDGPGVDPGIVLHAPGLGLRSVRERLLAHFGELARVRADTAPGQGFTVMVSLPAIVMPDAPRGDDLVGAGVR